MKRVLSFILVLSMILGSIGMVFADSASDIAGHKNEEAILKLNKLGIVEGDDRGFAPDDNITRAEFAVLVIRALGLESSANLAKGDTQFTDVTVALGYEWASGAINVASKLGYIQGYGGGLYGPADNIRFEDAIALIVRILGYEPAAQDRGGYPIGYLVVAERMLSITDNADGVAGVAATRGTVFQLLKNALTEPMMVQVGFGTDKKFVVSGKDDVPAEYLFDQLGFDRYVGRILDYNKKDLKVVIDYEQDDDIKQKSLNVEKGFDFAESFGTKLIAWADGKDLITYELDEVAIYDAVEVTKDEEEIKLIDADKKYKVTEDTIIFINGDDADAEDLVKGDEYDYAKVILDGKDVVFVSLYEWDDFIVVKNVDDSIIYQADKDELDAEKYIIVKGGKTISLDDISRDDIIFYNYDEEFAEIYNNSKEGKIQRVYYEEVKIGGDVYGFVGAKYLDAGEFGDLDDEILVEMEDEGDAVEFFLDRLGNLVLVIGTRAEVEKTSFYGYVAADTRLVSTGREDKWSLDVLNENGKIVEYDVDEKVVEDLEDKYEEYWDEVIVKGEVVKVTLDKDGDVSKVDLLGWDNIYEEIEQGDKYVQGFRLQNSAIVFWTQGKEKVKDYKVMTWAEAADEFDIVTGGYFFFDEDYRVVAIVAGETDEDVEPESLRGLVTKIRELRDEGLEITVEIEGKKQTFVTAKDAYIDEDLDKNLIVYIEVKDDEIEYLEVEDCYDVFEIYAVNRAKSTVESYYGDVYELIDKGIVYDLADDFEIIRLRDLKPGDWVVVFTIEDSYRFVDYIVLLGEEFPAR